MCFKLRKLRKGNTKRATRLQPKIESYEEKSFELIACEGSCEGGADIEGWVKYGIGCTEGYCKIHFRYGERQDKISYSCECNMHDGKMLSEASKDEKNRRIVTWIIGPKA